MGLLAAGLFFTMLSMALSSNILVVVPMPSKSHAMLFEPLVIELAKRGHHVTYVAPFKLKTPVKNIEEIFLDITIGNSKVVPPNLFEMRHFTPLHNVIFLPKMTEQITSVVVASKEVQQLLKSERKFDVLIMESFLTEALAAGLTATLKTPLIGFGTIMPCYWFNHWVGNEAPTSYIPDPVSTIPYRMSFIDRFKNAIFTVGAEIYQDLVHLRNQDAIMRKYFGDDLPPLKEIIANTSVLFVNDHYSLSFPRPAVPNLISIGGIHIDPPKPLPADLQKYMDNSKDGVILFSLGSNLKSADMGAERIQMFLNVFSKLKQNILWKFEENLPNTPKNVMTSSWLPQSDILGHPNLRLFITHGGLLSTTESVERGIPIIGIPIFGDQPMNMKQSVNAGVGLSLDFDLLSEQTIMNAIQEVLNNPKYNKAAKERSRAMKDVQSTPKETAVWWVEYVIRHKGAAHLRSTAQDLTWYQRQQLDVIAAILIIITTAVYIIKCATCAVCRKICRKNQNISKTKKNK